MTSEYGSVMPVYHGTVHSSESVIHRFHNPSLCPVKNKTETTPGAYGVGEKVISMFISTCGILSAVSDHSL
jgi:hypothetical protein